MFKKAKSFKLRENRESCTTLIAKGTRISGRVSFDGTLHIEGIVQGNINGESGLLTIAKGGQIEGDILAPNILIDGKVDGNVYAEGQLELSANAVVTGNVFYQAIQMEKGAQVNGSLEFQSGEPVSMHAEVDEPAKIRREEGVV